jgi:hypothetical protein
MGSRFNYQWVRNIPQALAGTLSDLSMESTKHTHHSCRNTQLLNPFDHRITVCLCSLRRRLLHLLLLWYGHLATEYIFFQTFFLELLQADQRLEHRLLL